MTVSSNNDNPEALFDGLLQAVVCTEVVGWRENARHLILILTDRGYHIAGDGKVEGQNNKLSVIMTIPLLQCIVTFSVGWKFGLG